MLRRALLYFPTSDSSWLVPELRELEFTTDNFAAALIALLQSGPLDSTCAVSGVCSGASISETGPMSIWLKPVPITVVGSIFQAIVKTLSTNVAAIYLSAEELDGRTDGGKLCALIRHAQAARGIPVWKSMDANLFINGDQILLLAWPTEARLFAFSDFEALLRAAHSCPADISVGSSGRMA